MDLIPALLLTFGISLCLVSASPLYETHGFRAGNDKSIGELGMMIYVTTGRCWSSYLGYGKHCGPAGYGTPIDATDRCCFAHDVCYERASPDCPGLSGFQLYLQSFEWTITEGRPTCGLNQTACQAGICECDRIFAECLKAAPYDYNYAPAGVPYRPPVSSPDPTNFLCFT